MINSLAKMRYKAKAAFSGVTDIIVVEQDNGNLTSTPFNIKFGKLKFLNPIKDQLVEVYNVGEPTKIMQLNLVVVNVYINEQITPIKFYLDEEDQQGYFTYSEQSDLDELIARAKGDNLLNLLQQQQQIQHLSLNKIILSKIPTSKSLKELNLKYGLNSVSYEIECKRLGKQCVDCELFYIKQQTKIFISDIDGTVTKSPTIGMIFSSLGKDYTQDNICLFYHKLQEKGYLILYMSARSMVQYESTKEYLQRQKQDDIQLPAGPVFLSTSELLEAFTVEVIKKQTDILKSRMLKDLALTIGITGTIKGGIGDRGNDIQAYRMAGLNYDQILLINKKGEIVIVNEKGEEQKTNIKEIIQKIDQIF